MADSKKPADPLAGLSFEPPPMAPAGSVRQPLGPPQGFYADQEAAMAAAGTPRDPNFTPYIQGDQWLPSSTYNKEDRDRLKARMNAAGLYGTSGYQSGDWTPEDANAFQIVLETANGKGVRDPEMVIDNIATEVQRGPRVQGPRAPLVSKITNPDDIRAVLRDSAFSLIGQRLSAAEEDRLVALYQGTQRSEDQATYDAGVAGGTVTGAPSMETFAESQIERLRPTEAGAHQHLAAFEKILGSLGTMVEGTPQYQGEGLPSAGQAEVL